MHFVLLLIILVFACILSIEYFQPCIPVTPYTYDIVKRQDLSRGPIPLCKTADPLGADEYSKKLPPVNCDIGRWYSFTTCDEETCGLQGKQTWKRNIITEGGHGGTLCPKELVEQRTCFRKCNT